uniref:receptor protein-tyrosine kinase n=1 Tax=Globisporangium ultimum (strain ATCC 200006 / CBS 805.95 / DAOM BR144) TaxID=431595 RepID=K3X1L9_GLOUD
MPDACVLILFLLAALFAHLSDAAQQYRVSLYNTERRVNAELVRVLPGNPGSAEVTLSWRSFHNGLYGDSDLGHTDAVGNKDPVIAYEAQYAVSGSGNWVSLSQTITGTGTEKQPDLHEKQRIWTRADAGQTISDGFFRLTLAHVGFSALDVHQRIITPEIPFDANEAQMKAALESLDVISNVQVFRRGLGAGAYEWIVLFDPPMSTRIDHGDLPLLILYTETISATWSGPDDQVAIQSLREAELEQIVCADLCSYNVKNASTGGAFSFRVRAHFTRMGWSEWSIASAPLQIPTTRLPRSPARPEFVSATTSRIVFKWQGELAPATTAASLVILFPILSYHVQQKCDQDLGWNSVAEHLEPGHTSFTFASSLARPPNSSCMFRVSATNANGIGPFSVPSLNFQTLPSVPDIPKSPSMMRHPLQFSWKPPSSDGGAAIVRYDVQYRLVDSSTWIQVAPYSVDSVNCTFAFEDVTQLLSYSRYAVRVKAVNAIGNSAFTTPEEFLTEYRVEHIESSPAVSPSSVVIFRNATRALAANTMDRYYANGIGTGGVRQMDGGHGLVVLFPINQRGEKQGELTFFFTSGKQVYQVPEKRTTDPMTRIVAIDAYGWGAGGGSGGKTSNDDLSNGGGGAFARGVFRVSPADRFEVYVGGGGRGSGASRLGAAGKGGFHGGGDAGKGDFSGGGGGGASEVRINGKTIVVAAGGGGGGSTDYCCAHGGGGGAGSGVAEEGNAPNISSIPLGLIEFQHTMRDEYHFENILGDVLDFTYARARHAHLDFGFAGPDADYSVLATGGAGKYVMNEVNSIMEISAPFIASSASSGRRMYGGKGEDGKDGGGGGGGGYFGGGGGGAGVDGGGGGGGSSFISFANLYDPSEQAKSRITSAWTQAGDRAESFQVKAISSTAVELSWMPPRYGYSHGADGFVIEMANRSMNEDFRIVRLETNAADIACMTMRKSVVRDLAPSSWYRFRVKVLFRDDSGKYSEIQTIQTRAIPRNVWRRVTGGVRGFSAETTGAGLWFSDPAPLRRLPSARRGHSLLFFDKFLYLFGGYGRGYLCNRAHQSTCILNPGVNNELWRFDLQTRIWMEVLPESPNTVVLPPAREKHSAVVVGDRVLVFGGRNADTDETKASFNDLWELSISSTTARTTTSLRDLETNVALNDGKEAFTMGNVGSAPDMCVTNMTVQLRITHSCSQTLHIQLFGPGGSKRETAATVSARSFPATLQSPSMWSANAPCVSGSQVFVYESSKGNFVSGGTQASGKNTRSMEALSVFHQFSVSGGWTLSVSDTSVDGYTGTLDAWDISFALAPCVPKFTWRNLSALATGTPPSPRYQHAAIVYKRSIFVYGGRNGANGKELNDFYRLDYPSTTASGSIQWTQLVSLTTEATLSERRFYNGRVTLVTPYDLLAIGHGLRSPRRIAGVTHHFASLGQFVGRKSVTDPRKGWRRVSISTVDEDSVIVASRYWSANAFVADDDTSNVGSRPIVYMFGGQDDTTLFDDFWQLDLDFLAEEASAESIRGRRSAVCNWRLSNAMYQAQWSQSCGATAALITQSQAKECSLETLLLYVWCEQQYQSISL